MAWEKRGSRLYYYRKRRDGRRVVSEYIGAGDFAEVVATLDELGRERRLLERLEAQVQRAELDADRVLGREVDEVCAAVRALAAAALLSSGYHMHGGQWRRKRCVQIRA